MYTSEQQAFLEYVTVKVEALFAKFPVPAHNFDHAVFVAQNAKKIALIENSSRVWLTEVAGILHDIGRVTEFHTPGNTKRHHELSYEMLREWFHTDGAFDILSHDEKMELLYAVRYHWNDAADDYDTAWILRDADKLDLLGAKGIERSRIWFDNDEKLVERDCCMKYYCLYWVHTETAKQMIKEKGLVQEMDDYMRTMLRSKIEPIEV